MELRPLGRTGIKVSPLCLGTMTWGEQNTQGQAFAQMDCALDAGINFFDTAELYSIPPKAATTGRTEEIIGAWFAARKTRERVVLATKVVGRSTSDWFREDGSLPKLNRKNIFEAVDKSLKRLKTDYIDLYQIHWPDRAVSSFGSNPSQFRLAPPHADEVPIEETLEAMDRLVKSGKVRAIGLSNESAWGTMRYLEAHRAKGLPRVQSIQNAYNFLNRTFEVNLAELALREDVGLLAYSVLAQGYLTGKYENGARPRGARRTLFQRLGRYEGPGGKAAITAYLALARELGLDPAQLAIAHAASRPFMTSAIIGATTMEQLHTALESQNLKVTGEIEEKIDALHELHGNPCP